MSSTLDTLKEKVVYTKDDFWYENPKILFRVDRINEFFPTKDMTRNEQLNAICRASIYISIILYVYSRNSNYLFITIIAFVLTYLVYSRNEENFESIVYPTQNNPFMNVQQNDYLNEPNRKAVSSLNNYNNSKLNKMIDEKFYYNLYRDVDDVYNVNNSQRQFYTTASTTIPNEQGKFVDWLYKVPPTCKEGNGNQCVANNFDWLKDSQYRNPFFI